MKLLQNKIKILLLYFNTLKFLKFSQFIFRFRNLVENKKISQKITSLKIIKLDKWINISSKKNEIRKNNYFLFLNKERFVNTNTWKIKEKDKLWLYNLHYFNFINTKNYNKYYHRKCLIDKWVVANKPFEGVAWERYPTSIRVVNWIKWLLSGNELSKTSLHSLYIQSRWIYKNPERHLLGNHFFSNLKALIFSACIFENTETTKWLIWSQKQMCKQLKEQILDDGGHFERSPMYHALFVEDILDLINLSNTTEKINFNLRHNLQVSLLKMLYWLKNMTHPDGEISLFNDAAFGIAKKYSELESYAKKLKVNTLYYKTRNKKLSLKTFLDSGYVRLENKEAVAILDVAPLGPDYLPAHGHADTLSFELSIFKHRVIVNGGTSCYGKSKKRLNERKTCSHSTIEINNTDSSQVWSNFRVGKRAYPELLSIRKNNEEINISCTHSGYVNQGIKVWPIRNWKFQSNQFDILDYLKGDFNLAVSRFILHPAVKVLKKSKTKFQLTLRNKRCIMINLVDCEGKLVRAKYADEFGKSISTNSLLIYSTGISRCQFIW